MAATKPKKQVRSGKATRRRTAELAASGHSNSEIAAKLDLTTRRIEQIVAEPEVQVTIEQLRERLESCRVDVERRLMEGLAERFEKSEGTAGLPFANLLHERFTAMEKSRAVSVPAGQSPTGTGEMRLEEFFAIARGTVRVG